MQEKWPPTVRKFCVFIVAISDLVCVCLCLGQAGRFFFKVRAVIGWCNKSWENSMFLLWLFLAYVCATWRNRSHVKIPHFRCSYFWLVCVGVSVCVYVCAATCNATESCENSVLSLQLFPAYVCVCLLCFLFGPGRAGFEVLINLNWICQLPHVLQL